MNERQTGRGSDQFNLRLPHGMRDRLKEEAADSGRSLNAEIVQRLQWSLDDNEEIERLRNEVAKRDTQIRAIQDDAFFKEKSLKETLEQFREVAALKDEVSHKLDAQLSSIRKEIEGLRADLLGDDAASEMRDSDGFPTGESPQHDWAEIARNAQQLAGLLSQAQAAGGADIDPADMEEISGRAADLATKLSVYSGDKSENSSKKLRRR